MNPRQITIGGIQIWVHGGQKYEQDVGTSKTIILGDEYHLSHFRNTPHQENVSTIVDLGANIGAFTLLARKTFPNARILAVEADPDNVEILKKNTENDPNIEVYGMAVLGDGCPSTVHLGQGSTNSGGSYVKEGNGEFNCPFIPDEYLEIPCISINQLLVENLVNYIDLIKIDVEGSEGEIISTLAKHDWPKRICWLRFEWHGKENLETIKRELSFTHELFIKESDSWNELGLGHRKI